MIDRIKLWAMYVLVVVAVCITPFVFGKIQAHWLRTVGTEVESARTDVYRENKSYVEGTVRDLREMQVEYVKASQEHKDALKSLILHRANELDWSRLPVDVQEFLRSLQ